MYEDVRVISRETTMGGERVKTLFRTSSAESPWSILVPVRPYGDRSDYMKQSAVRCHLAVRVKSVGNQCDAVVQGRGLSRRAAVSQAFYRSKGDH